MNGVTDKATIKVLPMWAKYSCSLCAASQLEPGVEVDIWHADDGTRPLYLCRLCSTQLASALLHEVAEQIRHGRP